MRVHVPVSLDLVVANHGEVRQGCAQVLLRLFAHGVKLHANGKWFEGGERQVDERQCAQSSGRKLQEVTSCNHDAPLDATVIFAI